MQNSASGDSTADRRQTGRCAFFEWSRQVSPDRYITGPEAPFPLYFRYFPHQPHPAGSIPSADRISENRQQSMRATIRIFAAYPGFKRLEPFGSIVAVFATHNLPFG